MSGLSVFRLVGNVSVNGGYGVAEVAEFGLPASTIRTGRFTSDRLPLDPVIAGHLTPASNVTYDLGSATHRWKDLYLSGNTIVLGNTFIREGLNESVQLGGESTTVNAQSFAGNGALLTSLDASALASGTIPDARIVGAYTGLTNLTANGTVTAATFSGNGASLVGVAPSIRTISTTAPLTGGGDLSANRTLAVSAATTSAAGVVQLNDTVTSTSTAQAATANAAKLANDNANTRVLKSGDTMTGDLFFSGATRYTGTSTNDEFRIRTNNTDRLTIQAGGNVGIGLTNPQSSLHVAGPLTFNNSTVPGVEMGIHSGVFPGIELLGSGAGATGWIDFKTTVTNADYSERVRGGGGFLEFHTNTAERMRIISNGNVGIGTTAPNAPLVVFGGEGTYDAPNFGSGNRGAIHIRSSVDDRRNAITFSPSLAAGDNADTAQAGIYVHFDNTNGTTMHLATTNLYATGPQARVTIGNTGNVGIGTTAPTAALQVQGTCRIDDNPAVNTAHSASGYNFLTLASGNAIQGWGKGSNDVAGIFTVDPTNAGWSGAASILYLSKSTSTNRSINAAGTVNASGADYAEYMTKCGNGDFTIAKGDVVGVDADGFLTDVYDDAVTFVIKSTNPSLVGGDDWGIEDMEHPKPPDPSTSMTPPGDGASEEEIAAYDAAVAAHDAWTAEFEAKRARVDRIAFSGQVPVNVYGATPGDYIVPVRRMDDGGISAIAVPDASITFEQYRKAVGKVVKILDDDDDEGGPSGGGRAFVIVKIA